MNEDDIKAIAKEYADEVNETPNDYISFLQWLSFHYCIVDKKKVVALYNRNYPPQPHDEYSQGIVDTFENLFGKKMFK